MSKIVANFAASKLMIAITWSNQLPMLMKQQNTTISICKGIAIILMVMGHAEGPGLLMNFIYLFHMPIFFITAGYFFSRRYLTDSWTYVEKRFKGLYVPMVKWSLIFLLLHNLFFDIGLLNEQFGNWSNGVTHPYTWRQGCQRAVNIVFSMAGYDEFLLGAFWFFRALLVSSILFMALYRVLDGRQRWLEGNKAVVAIILAALVFALFRIGNGLKVVTIVQGGIRENWGVIFFGLGVLYRSWEGKIRENWWLALVYFGLLLGGAHLHLAGMNLSPKLIDVLTLPITGSIGFLMVHYVSRIIDSHEGWLKRFLVHAGSMTIYIYVFHIISFKVVSAIKIMWYGLDWGQIGCHMVIHDHHDDAFWVLYTIAGVGLPLLWMQGYNAVKHRIAQRNNAQAA